MNVYQKSYRWKTYLGGFAIFIVFASLVYTNWLAQEIEVQERSKMEIYASTYRKLVEAEPDEDVTYFVDIINKEQTIPLISVNANGEITSTKNLNERRLNDDSYINRQLRRMKNSYQPIVIPQPDGEEHFLYYRGSKLLRMLKFFPFIQLGVIGLFLTIAYLLFSSARRAEQNQVWIGMSKETAHQLGTPIFSLLGWLEYMKEIDNEELQSIVPEMEKDLLRLELITDRFSKIGSIPKLSQSNVVPIVEDSFNYMKRLAPRKVQFIKELSSQPIQANLYPPLFKWVLENLIKNALDAMDAQGEITVRLKQKDSKVIIDVKDTGKGINSRNKQIVFRPGFSTKKRGWGLGLSLSKRIVEEYHHGKIYVLKSEKDKGTTFRIELEAV